ncbi:Butyryl-CoA dehydrogenase [plant metagenome]|uniref:Acyl-coenzyme A dehydrogenase n=1 Tax=plant metagenome TaxID=1297885 RepID=A0A484R7X0_9ZZZZ
MSKTSFRRDSLTKPIFRWARNALPTLSDTEREAIDAGDVWWDGDLFTGQPDWASLRKMPPAKLSAEEQAFIDGPVAELGAMLDDWDIQWSRRDLPPEAWAFIKQHRFFGMIIPKEYGGLGFSPSAHSEVVRRLSLRSSTAAVTVMVPNSLGPGELLMQFGTEEQRQRWLPRLAEGSEVPCFGLTSPEAGSDAASMTDTGVVCRQMVDGEEVLGIRLNWRKRYITLGPVATVLGLAFKLSDPDHLLGEKENIGISVALVPVSTPGVEIGRRHLPAMQMFQNGPNQGRDVFVPLDALIGGPERAGHGWQMLMSALAAGRGISLPSLSAAAVTFSAHTSGAYARVRKQFGIAIGKFEGVQDRLGYLAASAYQIEAARRLTCAALDQGHKPAVVSAIMKYHATERMRSAVDDAMDIHAGKAVIDGPNNYLGGLYRAVPVAITVEGANILTRCLIIFGQGAIRSHPFLMQEILALGDRDPERGLDDFDAIFWKHAAHAARNGLRAWGMAWTGGRVGPAPSAGRVSGDYRRLTRYASAFALVSEAALGILGGALKRKEMISARLGDVLSELYLLSATLKRWEDEGRNEADLPLVRWCMAHGAQRIEHALDRVLANLPMRPVAWALRALVLPLGPRGGPSDALTQQCAELLLSPSPTRDRIVGDIWQREGGGHVGLAKLERAFDLVVSVQPLYDRLREAGTRNWRDAHAKGALTEDQAARLQAAEEAVAAVVAVDDFDPAELTPGAESVPSSSVGKPGHPDEAAGFTTA